MATEFDEAQSQQQLDELLSHTESVFSEYISSLDSEPEELDQATIDEVLDRVDKKHPYSSPGNSATGTTDLAADLTVATLRAEGRIFQFGSIGTVLDISGKVKIWGTLSGKILFAVKNLPFGYFALTLIGAKGRLVYISTTRHKVKPSVGIITVN